MPTARCLADLLRWRAHSEPEHAALVLEGGGQLTYRDWQRRADATARGLTARGVRRGDRVALAFDNVDWLDYAVCYVAAHVAGAAAVPLAPRLSPDAAAQVCAHADVALVVATPQRAVAGDWPRADPGELAAGSSNEPLEPLDAVAQPGDLAEIVYTSGTTGTPKGVACTHEGLLVHDLPASAPTEPLAFAHAFPIGTNAGQECLRMPLRRPATTVVLAEFDPERLCAAIAARRVQRLQLVPATAGMLVASGAPARHDVSSVEAVTLSSAPVPPALLPRLTRAFPAAALYNAYALTEGGSARLLGRLETDRPASVGRPVGATEVRVVDAAGHDVATGTVGEVWLRRPGAPTRTYYRDPDATAVAFVGDWLRTGDLGVLDDDGCLSLVDRADDLVISGGLNISSVEVEHALVDHPAVWDAAVFGVPHPVLGQDLAAAVVADASVAADRADPLVRELQAFVRRRLGEHKVPRHVRLVARLPRTDTGKVRKRELRERFANEPAPTATPPRGPLEATLLAVWQAVLGRDDFGVHDDFFDLGGHSLAATQIVTRLCDELDADLPVTAVLEHPTVAELTVAVDDAAVEAP